MKLLLLCCLLASLEEASLLARTRIPCPALKIRNGRVRQRQKSSFAQYQCFKGYLLAGQKYSKCVAGKWDSSPPKCVRASCQKIRPPPNGMIHASHRGAVLNFSCKSGYSLKGPNMTSCDGRVWDSYLPACLPSDVMPSLSCDFESEDLCGWSHDLNHNFDWTRLNFKTPSGHIGTGPSYDHTKGDGGDGYYMYIESSSRNINDTARLISPVYEHQENNTCLEFYYHMYGITSGQLRVYLKKAGDPWIFNPDSAVFWKSGNHGDHWRRSFIDLGPIDDDFQVIFEGVRGQSYISDIAVDDVRLIENCATDEDIPTTTESETYTDAVDYESCLNRCDNSNGNALAPTGYAFLISCDCDDACTERSSCCLDYIPVCVLSDFTTSFYTDYQLVTNVTTQASTTTRHTQTTNQYITNTSAQVQSRTVQENSTAEALALTNPTSNLIKTTNAPTVTNGTQSTKRIVLTNTSEPTFKPYKRTVYLKTRATQNIFPYTKLNTKPTRSVPVTSVMTTKRLTQSTSKLTTKDAGITLTSNGSAKESFINETDLLNDIATIPTVTEEEELVPVMVFTTNKNYEDVPSSIDTDKYDSVHRLLSEKAATIKEKPKPEGNSITVIVVSVCVVVSGTLCLIFIVKRYTRNNCVRIKKMAGGNGSSQSDVRFLTSDEILDFTLATPDD